MALFNMGATRSAPFTLFEVPGKIYIFGQAHDATTLTPIFGDFLRNRPAALPSASSIFTAGSEMVSLGGAHHLENHLDNGMARVTKTSLGTSFDVEHTTAVSIGNGQYISINGGNREKGVTTLITKYESDGTVISSSTVQVGNPMIVYEDELNLYCTGRTMAEVMPSTGSANQSGVTLFSVNKSSLSVAFIEQLTIHNRVAPGNMMSDSIPLHVSSDGLLLITQQLRNQSLAAATNASNTPLSGVYATRITPGGVVERSTTVVNYGTAVPMGGTIPTVYRYLSETPETLTFITVAPNTAANIVAESQLQMLLLHVNKESLAIQFEKIGVIVEADVDYSSLIAPKTAEFFTTFDIQAIPSSVETEKVFILTQLGMSSVKTVGQSASVTVRMNTADLASSRVTQVFKHRPNILGTGFLCLSKFTDQFFISYGDQGGDFLQINAGNQSLIKKESIDFPIASCMVDQVGRFWVQDDSNGSIHLFSQTTTATLKVGFADKTIKFDGTVINSNIIVSAYNHLGTRVANNIVLNLEGSSATFADGAKSTTIATSTDGDTLVPIKIVGNGYVRVAANLAV